MCAIAAIAPDVLRSLPGYAIGQTYRVLRHAMDDALRDLDLTAPQWGTLTCLEASDGLTGADMARMHHLTPQTMHTILHNLELAGLILREPHPQHGTVLRIHLTVAGRERLPEATHRVEAVHQRMLRTLDEEQRATLLALLQQCVQALDARGDLPCPE